MRKLMKKHIAIFLVWVMVLSMSACAAGKAETVTAGVTEIEKYGHAVLDLTTADFLKKGYALGDVVRVRFGSYESEMPFFDGYYTNPGGEMLRGLAPEKNIAVCINYGDFSKETGIAQGDTVEITLVKKAGMLAYQELCALKYSDDRADFADDRTFANFRPVTLGTIAGGKLYRSASPINNKHGRAAYANALIEEAGVATVVNLADSDEDIAEYIAAEDYRSGYYVGLYLAGNVIALDMTGDFFSEKFASSVVKGLTFLAQREPPYSIHCTEGKDRAGFVAMILGALMGAELQEIIDDYMLSFHNYYGIDKATQPERYEAVLTNNLMAMLCHVMGAESEEALKKIDLQSAVTKYLLDAGMAEADLLALKQKLA